MFRISRVFVMGSLSFLIALMVAAFGADIVPVDQRLALQIAGLTLQNANLSHDLESCKDALSKEDKK